MSLKGVEYIVGSIKKMRAIAAAMTTALALGAAGMTARAQQQQPDSIFTEEEQAYIELSGTLKVGYVRDRKPVSFQDENGELAGISRGIFDRISEISGLQFEYIELPAGDVTYDYLISEGFDLVTGVEYNKENQKAHGILMRSLSVQQKSHCGERRSDCRARAESYRGDLYGFPDDQESSERSISQFYYSRL